MAKILAFGISLILVLQTFGAFAQSRGSWFFDTDNPKKIYAATMNDSNNVFGQYCFPEERSCYWLLALTSKCVDGDKYPVLANAGSGALHLEIACFGPVGGTSKLYQYVITDFDKVSELIAGNPLVGFAIPLQDDQFRVVRFDLKGASTAITQMRKSGDALLKSKGRSTKDQTL